MQNIVEINKRKCVGEEIRVNMGKTRQKVFFLSEKICKQKVTLTITAFTHKH